MEMVYPFVRGLKDTDGQHSEGTNAFQLETDKKLKRKLMKQESEKIVLVNRKKKMVEAKAKYKRIALMTL